MSQADHVHGPDGPEGCFACKARSVHFDPRAMPSRRNTNPPRTNPDSNAWERGVKRDERGMPLLKANGQPIPIKEYTEKRHIYEAARRRLANS